MQVTERTSLLVRYRFPGLTRFAPQLSPFLPSVAFFDLRSFSGGGSEGGRLLRCCGISVSLRSPFVLGHPKIQGVQTCIWIWRYPCSNNSEDTLSSRSEPPYHISWSLSFEKAGFVICRVCGRAVQAFPSLLSGSENQCIQSVWFDHINS